MTKHPPIPHHLQRELTPFFRESFAFFTSDVFGYDNLEAARLRDIVRQTFRELSPEARQWLGAL